MNELSWEVGYPDGLVKYIDYFRKKYFQYDVLDSVVDNYIKNNSNLCVKKICSLGSGTGRHEVELSKLGYDVIGLEKNKESVEISNNYVQAQNTNVLIKECDFLNEDDVDKVMSQIGMVDAVVMLLIPISISDYAVAANNMSKWIKPGGLFVVDNFGYEKEIDPSKLLIESNVEVANDPYSEKYAVRLNYYEYKNNIVDWNAIYLYHDKDNKLCMKRDHDILDVVPEEEGIDPLRLNKSEFEMVPTHKITECEEGLTPPYLYEYLVGWRKMQ